MSDEEMAEILRKAGFEAEYKPGFLRLVNGWVFGFGLKDITADDIREKRSIAWRMEHAWGQLQYMKDNPDRFPIEFVACALKALALLNCAEPERMFDDLSLEPDY